MDFNVFVKLGRSRRGIRPHSLQCACVCVNQLDVSPFVLLLFRDEDGASLLASLRSFEHLVSQTRRYFFCLVRAGLGELTGSACPRPLFREWCQS